MKSNREKNILDRRTFIKNTTAAGVSAAVVNGSSLAAGMMVARSATAAGTQGIRRVICLYVPDGAPVKGKNRWLPTGNLNLVDTSLPLEGVKQDCIFFKQTLISDKNGTGCGGHANTDKAFGGIGQQSTYDVELAKAIGDASPFPSLQLGIQSRGKGGLTSPTKKNGNTILYENNPIAAFNRLFGSSGSTGGNSGSSSNTQLSKQRIVDIHKAELDALKRSLGSAERSKLAEHLNSVKKLEDRLEASMGNEGPSACSTAGWNSSNFVYSATNKSRFTREAQLQMDTSVLALQCNLTNVISISLGNHQAEQVIPTLTHNNIDYHKCIHGGNINAFIEMRAYLSEQVAYLIKSLKNAKDEFGESLLDSTLVIQSSDMGDGNVHSSIDAPIMLAGGGSSVRSGRVISAARHTSVFDTASELLGVSNKVIKYGQGPVTGVIA